MRLVINKINNFGPTLLFTTVIFIFSTRRSLYCVPSVCNFNFSKPLYIFFVNGIFRTRDVEVVMLSLSIFPLKHGHHVLQKHWWLKNAFYSIAILNFSNEIVNGNIWINGSQISCSLGKLNSCLHWLVSCSMLYGCSSYIIHDDCCD